MRPVEHRVAASTYVVEADGVAVCHVMISPTPSKRVDTGRPRTAGLSLPQQLEALRYLSY
jgi:hypothetical protein